MARFFDFAFGVHFGLEYLLSKVQHFH